MLSAKSTFFIISAGSDDEKYVSGTKLSTQLAVLEQAGQLKPEVRRLILQGTGVVGDGDKKD